MSAATADQDARELVAKSCRILGGLELTKAATGHVSQRAPDGKHILVRARGPDEVGVRYTTSDQVITVDENGKKVDGPEGLSVPQEVFIHTWLYKTRPEVKSVIHIHPATVVLFTITHTPLLPIYGAYDQEATVTAIKVNELAEMNYRARLLGDPDPIPDEDLAHFKKRVKTSKSRPSAHLGATWRYYAELTKA
jgi:L-fuculose-phosphate aldolase